jgi:hypothetical protein
MKLSGKNTIPFSDIISILERCYPNFLPGGACPERGVAKLECLKKIGKKTIFMKK